MDEQKTKYKAADISEEIFLQAILKAYSRSGYYQTALRCDVEEIVRETYPNMPLKVITAKFKRLLARRLVNGCDCGCRGDWRVVR